jgi:hypothetical protein
MGLVEPVAAASKAPGFADLVPDSDPNAYTSLLKRLIRIASLKNTPTADGTPLNAAKSDDSAESSSVRADEPIEEVEVDPTLENLQLSLAGALASIRRRLWPSSATDPQSPPIVTYSTGPLVMSMADKPVVAKELYVGRESKTSGKWSFEIGVNGQNIPLLLGWLVSYEVKGVKQYETALLNLRSGTFSSDGRTVQYLPQALKIRGGDILTAHVDIDNRTFTYTLNGVRLPDLHTYAEDGDRFDRYIEDPTNPGCAFRWSSANVLIKLPIGQNASFHPALSYVKQSPIHVMPSLSCEYGPIFDLSPMKAHKEQCDLLLELIFEIMQHAAPAKEPKSAVKLGSLRAKAASHSHLIDSKQLDQILNVVIGSVDVGLRAMFPDEALRSTEETPQLHHVEYVLQHSVLPFLVHLQSLEITSMREKLIDCWVNLLAENDDWAQNFLTDILEAALNYMLRNPDTTVAPLHPEMTLVYNELTRPQVMALLTRLLELPRLYYLIASSGLFVKMMPNLFIPAVWDHQVRLEPYVPKESWFLFQKLGAVSELVEVLQYLREAQNTRLASHSKLIYVLARHPPLPSQPKDSESRKNTNDFILALRTLVASNSDILRMKSAAYYMRPALNGLMFALLGAIELAGVRAERIFNDVLHPRVLLDPARSIVDRLGGTYSHVLSHYPNAYAELQAAKPETPETEFRDSQTSWPLELLDACVFLYYYAFVPALTTTQGYSNDMEMTTRTIENLNGSKRRRGPDRPCADLDLAIEIQQQLSRVFTISCIMLTIEIFDEKKVLLMKKFGDWMSQMLIHTALHPTRGSIIYYVPESYIHLLVTVESTFRILKTKSAMCLVFRHSYPPDNTLALPISEREDPKLFPDGSLQTEGLPTPKWRHSLPTCAMSILIQKNVILNPNLISIIVNYLCRVVGSISLNETGYILGPKRFSQFMDVVFTCFTDNKNSHWTTILDGLVPFLADPEDSVPKLYRTYFTRWISDALHRQKVENFLNALFNFGSWTENEFDTHIDNYIEKLKNITSNVDQIVADPKRMNDLERPESRAGRQQADERGFAKSSAKPEWETIELTGGKVVVVLPVDDVYARLHRLKELVPLQQGLETAIREVPLYLSVLSQLLFVLASIAQLNPLIFDNPLIMTRTCELVGHTLRRTLDQSSSPPFVKFARLVGQSLSENDTILYTSPQPMPFYDTNAKQLVWSCTKLIVSLLSCSATKTLCLQSLAGLITNSAVDLYLTLEFTNIAEWHATQSILQDLKHVTAREVLLRSGQEECPICYANPVNTTFEPCGHRSCQSCIDRHLLNNTACFFCKAKIESTRRDGF